MFCAPVVVVVVDEWAWSGDANDANLLMSVKCTLMRVRCYLIIGDYLLSDSATSCLKADCSHHYLSMLCLCFASVKIKWPPVLANRAQLPQLSFSE